MPKINSSGLSQLAQKSNDELADFIALSKNIEFRNRAGDLLQERSNRIKDLALIITHCDEELLLDKVWDRFKDDEISNLTLISIIKNNGNPKFQLKAWKKLSVQQPSKEDLYYTICESNCGLIKSMAWQMFKYQCPSIMALGDMLCINNSHELNIDIWNQLKGQGPSNDELVYIIRCCRDVKLREEVWEQFKQQEPLKSQLFTILLWCNNQEFQNRVAHHLLYYPLSSSELADIEKYGMVTSTT